VRLFAVLLILAIAILGYFAWRTDGFGIWAEDYRTTMASSAHGYLFDNEGELVDLDTDRIEGFMIALLRDAEAEPLAEPDDELVEVADRLAKMIAEPETSPGDRIVASAFRVRALGLMMDKITGPQYIWRADYLQNQYLLKTDYLLKPIFVGIGEIIRRIIERIAIATPYANMCGAQDVPIAPFFGAGAGIWSSQGNLANNILAPGQAAAVWTWADPAKRGGCVALPRASGQAGIICQSATTGRACFWDNLERGTGKKFAWATDVKPLRDLQDGAVLAETCPECHKGNNVFLLSPDDPTWCKLMRGGQPGAGCVAMAGNPGTFTLKVEGAVDQIPEPGAVPAFNHSRYIPISTTPPRAGWVNGAQPGCAGDCHLDPPNKVANEPNAPGMPPNCGANCYLP